MPNRIRIAYIYYILAISYIGLKKKIQEQANCSPNNFDFFLLNRFEDKKKGRVNFIKIDSAKNYYDYFFRKFELIENSINLSNYDYIVLRYPFADKSGLKFTRKYNVISEHQTDEIYELKGNLIGQSSISTKLASLLRLILEYKYGRNYRNNCRGIISVTDQIRKKELARASEIVNSITISNGIDTKTITQTGFNKIRNRELNLIFVASNLAPWHGLERIAAPLAEYEGDYAIKLNVVGNIKSSDLKTKSSKNIVYHGIKNGAELDRVFSSANLAVSSLGLHLANLEEAAVLKTREYTARGIPFLLAYDDLDLLNIDKNKLFYLKFPNKSDGIPLEKVISFCEELNDKHKNPLELSEYMHNYAIEHMDWRQKMNQYLTFCQEIGH